MIKENIKISESVCKIRKKYNLSQNMLAEKIGVSRAMISCYESGARQPRLEILMRISSAYGISIDDLIKGNVN